MDSSPPQFKIVLVGNSGVGKTCLVRQFTQREFVTKNGATIGVDFLIKPLKVDGKSRWGFPRKCSLITPVTNLSLSLPQTRT